MDAILEMLRGLRLNGALFLEARFTAPWCVLSEIGPEDCAPFTAVPRHIIAYHYVTAGSCLVKVEGEAPVEVTGGEIVVLPQNQPHLLGSNVGRRPIKADGLVQPGPPGGLARIEHGGGGAETRILCGYLGSLEAQPVLLGLLPGVLKIAVLEGAAGAWIESSIRFAAEQLARGQLDGGQLDGGQASAPGMLAKLAELLFMEAVRRHLASAPAGQAWAAGLQDPAVARALGLLHGQLARRWTAEDLAEAVALSRSAFAERFTRALGEPPMRYLARRRLEQAAAQLKDTAAPIARIAYDVGYESETAFNRAFRREYGLPPAAWRRESPAR